MRKAWIWIGGIALAAVLYNVDAIYGQWKFNQLCKKEGGPRIYTKIERNVGWIVEDHILGDRYKSAFQFEDVAFVRYRDEQGKAFDVHIKKRPWPQAPEYIFAPVDQTQSIRYKYVSEQITLPDDDRIGRYRREIVDLNTGRVVASYTRFGYQWTKPERVILNAPTGVGCWDEQADIDNFRQSIYKFGSK